MSGDYSRLLERRAEAMLRLAERLLVEGEYDLAALNAEYAAQLYIKGVLHRLSGEEWRGHSIRSLLGVLAMIVRDAGLDEASDRIYEYIRNKRRILAELEEAHTRAVYGVFEYSREQAETLVAAAKEVIELVRRVEEEALG